LRERRTEVVDVSLGQASPVIPFFPIQIFDSTYVMQGYYTAREVRMEKEKARNAREAEKQKASEAKNAKNTKNTPASGSRPSHGNINRTPVKEPRCSQLRVWFLHLYHRCVRSHHALGSFLVSRFLYIRSKCQRSLLIQHFRSSNVCFYLVFLIYFD
jgi:hypothetical protein